MKRFPALVWLSAVLSVGPPACVYDGDQRCGPHQVLLDNDRCACEDGFVPGTAGCVPCGEYELTVNGQCACVDGYARPAADAACEPIPAELGAACDSDAACPSGSYSSCHVNDDGTGYCTSGCTNDDDCDGGYRCHLAGADSYCRRPPNPNPAKCQSSDECTEGDATFCETLQSHLCLVPCSAGHTDVCFEGEVCCNYVVFQPICVPADSCASNGGSEVN